MPSANSGPGVYSFLYFAGSDSDGERQLEHAHYH